MNKKVGTACPEQITFNIIPLFRYDINLWKIENFEVLAILQILNEYRMIFQGSEGTDLLEIYRSLKAQIISY